MQEGDSFSAERVNKWFEDVWTGNDLLPNGKVQCLHQLDMIELYRGDKRELGYVVLLAIEHQMKVGDLKNRVQHTWDGRLSIEHILPQVCSYIVLRAVQACLLCLTASSSIC